MPPNTLLGLLLFLWLVTPGFLFTLLASRRRATAKESAFRETAQVVLASVAFSSAGAAVAAVLVGARVDVDPGRLISEGRPYLGKHYRAVAAFLGLQIVVACGLAGLVNFFEILRIRTATDHAPPRLTQESAWDRPLGRCPAGSRPQAWVRLTSGVELRGIVAAFGHEIDVQDRELVLKDPIEIRYPRQTMQPVREQRVVVQGADIEFLAVQYIEDEKAPEPRRRWWQQRRKTRTTS